MQVIAAINLYNGRCVDTLGSDYDESHDADPISIAVRWNNIGANWVHLADINAIRGENDNNAEIIRKIISKVNVPVQVAANVQDIYTFEELLAAGAGRVVIDNKAVDNTEFIREILERYPEKVIILFNSYSGETDIDGNYHEGIIDIVNSLKQYGLRRIIYHDISQNYIFNYDDLASLAKNTGLAVIACGKLNNLETIKRLKQLSDCEDINLEGIILAKPLYTGEIDLYEVIKLIKAYPYIGDFYSREDIC